MPGDIPAQGFIREDAEGPYLSCASFVGGHDATFCDGRQRPRAVEETPDTGSWRRWVCPDCGASTRQRLDSEGDGVVA